MMEDDEQYPSREEFQKFVASAVIRHNLKDTISHECQTSVSSVERWALGESAPHPAIRKFVLEHIGPMVEDAEDERRESRNKSIAFMRSLGHAG
jgi:hypothetical protein